MALSFTPARPLGTSSNEKRRRVLVTGAAGNIGSFFAEHSHKRYDLRLMVHSEEELEPMRKFGEAIQGDIIDFEQMKEMCRGIDTVVHLAAHPSPSATWDQLLELNIEGTYHVLVAAKAAGCRRVIYASSIHAVSGYAHDVQVKTTDPVNPGDLYGVTKCFGEALGRYMAEKEGLSVIALRIGAFQPMACARDENSVWLLDAFVSRRDLNQLIEKCIDVENLQWAVFNGLSDNRYKRLDITDARELVGYAPQDDLAEENPALKESGITDSHCAHNQGDPGQKSGLRHDV